MDSNLEQELIKVLDELIEKGHWDNGLFLQASGKKLRELRERIIQRSNNAVAKQKLNQYQTEAEAFSENALEIYILLYTNDAYNLKKWENILSNLDEHSISRPIYKSEGQVKAALRAKQRRDNDAYVAVQVNAEDILKPAQEAAKDSLGQELLLLRQGAIHPDRIIKFVHLDAQYTFKNGRLRVITK